MAWRENPTPDDYRRLHVPYIDLNHLYDYREWRWPHWKFDYKADDLFESLHKEFNCIPFAIQDPCYWFYDVHELINASETREEFETALRKRRDERFQEIRKGWSNTVGELALNIPVWGSSETDQINRWNAFIELSRHFSFGSLLAHFVNYLPKNPPNRPNVKSTTAPKALDQPEQTQQPDQPSPGLNDAQIRRHVQELINRLTSDNITQTIDTLICLYQTDARQLVTSALLDSTVAFTGSTEKRVDFLLMIAEFISAANKTMGVDVSRQFVRHLMETTGIRFAATSETESDAGSKCPDPPLTPPSPPPPSATNTRKTRASRKKTSKGPVRNGRVEKPPPQRRITRNSTSVAAEGTRRSARLRQRAARSGSG
ncbi:hypothetical protein F4680DRAFT_470852 [Xylaria scruposa]|nr:hypothetical protein F4680DRAFT_470852 [Xylaria scruposa]